MIKARWSLTALAVAAVIAGRGNLLGQIPLSTERLCLFDTSSSEDKLFTFSSDVAIEARVDSLVALAGQDRSFVVASANIARAAAATTAPNSMLLYSQELFAETERGSATDWSHLTILCHQLAHLLLRHTLTAVPADRKLEELEADQFAGTLIHAFGGGLEQALSCYRDLPAHGPATARLYPSKTERLAAAESGWRSLGESLVTNFVTEGAVPTFLLPPPRPSAWKEIPLERITGSRSTVTLGELGALLEKAFIRAGYNQLNFYSIAPHGFAVVTQVEQVTVDGFPKSGTDRFSVKISAPRLFSLTSYLQALLGPSRGHFRLVTVLVSPVPLTYNPEPASLRHSIDWLWGGMTRLPASIARRPLTAEYSCTALVYEFTQPSAFTEAIVRVPGSLSAQDHLRRSGLWQALGL